MKKILFILVTTLLLNLGVYAQDSRQVEGNANPSNSITTAKQRQQRLKAFNKHPYTLYYDRLIVEYEQRMKANAKKYKVMARKMQKPQYSDPSYFGHKRKPKKRPVGKRKYCKECEIVH